MPIEAGFVASDIVKEDGHCKLISDVPLADKLHRLLIEEIQPLAIAQSCKKCSLELNEDELKRQAEFITRYFKNDQRTPS